MAEKPRLGKKTRVQVERSPKPALRRWGQSSWSTPGGEGFLFGNLCNMVLKFLPDVKGRGSHSSGGNQTGLNQPESGLPFGSSSDAGEVTT